MQKTTTKPTTDCPNLFDCGCSVKCVDVNVLNNVWILTCVKCVDVHVLMGGCTVKCLDVHLLNGLGCTWLVECVITCVNVWNCTRVKLWMYMCGV